jgi:hypothetical protein
MDPREEANNYVDRHKIMKLFEELGEQSCVYVRWM